MSGTTTDEHGSVSASGSSKKGRGSGKEGKRRTSFFGKIKEIFSDHHHHHQQQHESGKEKGRQ